MQTDTLTDGQARTRRNPRGVFEKVPGSGVWWVRHADKMGRIRREKAGSKSAALLLYHKRSYHDDVNRMERLLGWFRERTADSITPQDIERRMTEAAEENDWAPATINRLRALISLTYRLGIESGKVSSNPARLVKHRQENNARIRWLTPEEEVRLRAAIEATRPEHLPEL